DDEVLHQQDGVRQGFAGRRQIRGIAREIFRLGQDRDRRGPRLGVGGRDARRLGGRGGARRAQEAGGGRGELHLGDHARARRLQGAGQRGRLARVERLGGEPLE